jgi:NAD(P)-dependent dehydrogenase (short-subunit alcohol dehydrogenase family)
MIDLSGQVAAITGGAGELCGEMAEALIECGAAVVILDIDLEKAKARAQAMAKAGGIAVAVKADVTRRKSLEQARGRVEKRFNRLDILINGAGGNASDATTSEGLSFFDLDEGAIRRVFELNCLGTIFSSQVFGRMILETAGAGSIINISSMNAFRPLTRIPAYSSAKAAVSNFTQWLAVHMAQNYTPRIRVNAIAPGFFLTEQNRFLLRDQGTGKLSKRGRAILAHTPVREFGRASDLISTLLWLISPESRLVTGVVAPVDGGFSAFSGV